MHGRHIPYLVGGFMLLPYGFWLIAWAFFLPGPKAGFNVPMSMAMFAVTVPLVAWFFLANLSFMANSIAGADPFQRPATRWVRWTVAKLPAATLLIGVATLPYLLASEAPLPLALLPLLVALLVSWAIDRGEAAREREARRGERTAAQARPRAVETLTGLGRFVLQAVYRVPVIGWMSGSWSTATTRTAPSSHSTSAWSLFSCCSGSAFPPCWSSRWRWFRSPSWRCFF